MCARPPSVVPVPTKRPVAELILGEERGARVAARVGDALAPAGGERRRDAIVAILRQRERAVEDAPGAELALERQAGRPTPCAPYETSPAALVCHGSVTMAPIAPSELSCAMTLVVGSPPPFSTAYCPAT